MDLCRTVATHFRKWAKVIPHMSLSKTEYLRGDTERQELSERKSAAFSEQTRAGNQKTVPAEKQLQIAQSTGIVRLQVVEILLSMPTSF